MAVTCAGRAPDAELVALLRRLLDMAGDSAAFDTNKLYDGLCRVECAEERIVITRRLMEIRASAGEAGVACASGAVMAAVHTFVRSCTTPLLGTVEKVCFVWIPLQPGCRGSRRSIVEESDTTPKMVLSGNVCPRLLLTINSTR